MPNVDGQKFPYTAEGKMRAIAAAKAKKKTQPKKNVMPYKVEDKTSGMGRKSTGMPGPKKRMSNY